MSARDLSRLKELEVKYRGLAIGDGLREAADALASAIGEVSDHPRSSNAHYPFERAMAQHFRKMEARYGSLFEAAPDALVVVDGAGEIVLVNNRAAAQFGYDAHDLVGVGLAQIGDGAFVEHLALVGAEAAVVALGDQPLMGVEFLGMRKDGSRFQAEVTLGLVEAADGKLLLIAIRDITARKGAERTLVADALRARRLVDDAPVALIVTNKRNRIVAINVAAQRMFGKDAAAAVGLPVETLLPPALADSLIGSHDDGTAAGSSWVAHDGNRPDGTPIELEAAISAAQDAQGRMAIVAIREIGPDDRSARLAAAVLRAAPDAMMVVDGRGALVLLNAEAERRFGYSENELTGCSASRILPHSLIEGLQPDTLRFTEAALAREIGAGIETVGQRRDGSRFPVELLFAPLDTAAGRHWIVTSRDISVRHAARLDLPSPQSFTSAAGNGSPFHSTLSDSGEGKP